MRQSAEVIMRVITSAVLAQGSSMNQPSNPTELRGAEAVNFAGAHLRKVRSNPDTWEVEYVDDSTGEHWLMDYPHSEQHGGGSPRLRKV
jgi:hypothetical protein